MEKQVSKWLTVNFGYQAAADSQLSAACRGNLKGLWEFLIANYHTSEHKQKIQHTVAKHRHEQEAARRAPELHQQALQQKKHLCDLQHKAQILDRTLISLQAAAENAISDSVEQNGDKGLLQHDLREPATQAVLLQGYIQLLQQLLPILEAKIARLQTVADLARSRCHNKGSQKRLMQLMQQTSNNVRSELFQILEGKLQQPTGASNQVQEPDQQLMCTDAGIHSTPDCNSGFFAGQGMYWSGAWQTGDNSSLVASYHPSEAVRNTAVQLLQEHPDQLLNCSSHLAAQASHELTAALDEAEMALLAPAGKHVGRDQGESHLSTVNPLAASYTITDGTDAYSLPWTSSWSSGCLGQGIQQQPAAHVTPEMQVKQRQQFHLQLYLKAKEAAAAAQTVEVELTRLLGSTPLLQHNMLMGSSSWEAELAGLWLRGEGLRGEVGLLEHRRKVFERDVDSALKAETELQETWQQIQAAVREDRELNNLLWQVASDNLTLYTALCAQQDEVLQLLRRQLLPCSSSSVHSAQAGKDQVLQEVAKVSQLPLTAVDLLQPVRARGGSTGAAPPEPHHSIINRLQAAAQRLSHMGRPTTVGKTYSTAAGKGIGRHAGAAAVASSWDGSHGHSSTSAIDNAAVSALQSAAAVDMLAPASCPAALIKNIAGKRQQSVEMQEQLQQLETVCQVAVNSSKEAHAQTKLLEDQVNELRMRDLEEVLPQLNDLLAQSQNAQAFARYQVQQECEDLMKQPAQHLLPDHKFEGKSCTEWLMEMQALHGRRRELLSRRM